MKHGSSLIMLIGSYSELARPCLVQRSRATEISVTSQCYMCVRIDHHRCLRSCLSQSNHLVVQRIDKPFTFTITFKSLHIDDIHLFRSCLYGQFCAISRLIVSLIGTHPNHIGRSRFQVSILNGKEWIGTTPHLHKGITLLHLNDETVLVVGVISP